MKRWGIYLRLEFKKMIKTVPTLLAGMILFLGIIAGILIFSNTIMENSRKEFQIIKVGIVGSEDEKYTKLAISMIEKMETVQYSCEFSYCSEQEADTGLEEGKYDVAIIIPKDYVKGFMHGENKTIIARFGQGQTGVASYIMKQLAEFAKDLLIESEKNIYSMQDYYREIEPDGERQALIDINVEYIQRILAREDVYLTEAVSRTDGLSMDKYYFCDAIVLIFLFLGLQSAKILQKNAPELDRKLAVAGVGAAKQISARMAALCGTFFSIYLIFAALLMIGLPLAEKNGILILEGTMWTNTITLLKISLILIPICALILFVYELFRESVNGILLLFVSSIALAFMAGCFYPLSFLPKQIQYMSQFTPIRAAFAHTSACIIGEPLGVWTGIMMLHTLVLITMSVAIRYIRIKMK